MKRIFLVSVATAAECAGVVVSETLERLRRCSGKMVASGEEDGCAVTMKMVFHTY
jgi:hypothetical protein